MARPVVIISDLLPPKRGGLADHTHRLGNELAQFGPVTVLTSPGTESSGDFLVRASIGNWSDLDWIMAELREFPDDSVLLWQYVPHMYGRGGVNRQLPRFWRDLKRVGQRQVFLAHEIMADLMMLDIVRRPAHFWYAMNHRRQWNAILANADAVPISTGRWVENWTARRPDVAKKFSLLASPTSIEPVPVPPDHAAAWRAQHRLPAEARIITYFGTISAAKQLPWVIEAWRAAHTPARPVALALIGSAPTLRLPDSLQKLYRPLGYLPAEDASRALHASDLLALPFVDGISERRTTLMAGLAHGLPVATTNGHNTGAALRKADFLALTNADDEDAFIRSVGELFRDDARRARMGAAGKAACARDYSWPVTISRLRALLEPTAATG
ncbi:MAG TPA: glycosyltransferase family 4 protein [Candidatus Limnocylindria bacterium]|nr:glycosyltransferase family 4 protein [Candidatus Limnocylindria bacterium]